MNGFLDASIVLSGRALLLPAIGALVVLAAALVWSGHRSAVERRVKIGCGLLKAAGACALLLCLLEPTWVGRRAKPGANLFAIVADNSRSLQVVDAGEKLSRGGLLRESLAGEKSGWQAPLASAFQVRRYVFDSRLRQARDFTGLDFAGRSSALNGALSAAVENWRGQPVAGVLLFTDGNATDPGLGNLAGAGYPPVYPVTWGSGARVEDISLQRVSASQTAFEDAPVTLQGRVDVQGFPGKPVTTRVTEIAVGTRAPSTNAAGAPLRLSLESNVVASVTQRARDGEPGLDFRFQLEPAGAGLHFYSVEAEAGEPGKPAPEATYLNNRQVVVVDRGQQPFRILYVGGQPNWEYKFLNRALLQDPQVQMVSLIRVARREPKFEFKGRPGESSNPLFRGFDRQDEDTARYDQPVIVRLNTRDEFELRGGFPQSAEELFGYDALILDHVEAGFFNASQMALVRQFVSERGGGLLMLGGAESFYEGRYAGTPIGSVLPVYVDQPPRVRQPGRWQLTLTRDGWLQPWIRLRPTELEEQRRLGSMPPFQVLNVADGIKPGAGVLATVSDPSGQTLPALVAQRFGHGRTAALMIGDLWRWGLHDETAQADLAKSWRQLVRWLVSDVPHKVSVTMEDSGAAAGAKLIVKAHDATFQPLDNATVRLSVQPIPLASRDSSAASNAPAGPIQLTAEPSVSDPGVYEATYVPSAPGAFLVEATVLDADGRVAGRAAAGWAADPDADEFRSLNPNLSFLQSLAHESGGEMVAMRNIDSFIRQLPQRSAPVMEPWSYPLWHLPAVFGFVLTCFVAEWGIRRWKGLP